MCDHIASELRRGVNLAQSVHSTRGGAKKCAVVEGIPYRDLCGKCGARRVDGQIGLEPTPAAYVAEMVAVFREVRRVLRDDGTLWLNLGDSYAGSGMTGGTDSKEGSTKRAGRMFHGNRRDTVLGLKPKDLVGIPWMVAFALRDDGWFLRSEVIWHKNNPMPESVTDRPTKSHEQVFLLSKNERYFYDADAVREPARYGRCVGTDWGQIREASPGDRRSNGRGSHMTSTDPEAGRNLRSVWTIPTESFPGSHFATFPRELVEPCIRAGTSERGACPACGGPWERIVERGESHYRQLGWTGRRAKDFERDDFMPGHGGQTRNHNGTVPSLRRAETKQLGWQPSCSCDAGDPVPCIVLDPFIGSGTTIIVAEALGRRAIGLDLSRPYLDMAARRIDHPHARTPRPGRAEHLPLFDREEPTWTA